MTAPCSGNVYPYCVEFCCSFCSCIGSFMFCMHSYSLPILPVQTLSVSWRAILHYEQTYCVLGEAATQTKFLKKGFFPSFESVKPGKSKFFVLVWRKGERRFMYDRLIVHLIWRMQNCKTSWWIYSRQIFWQRITATTVNFTLCSNKEKSKQMVLHN